MKHSWIKLCWLLSILSVTYACESDRLIENGLIAFPNTQDTTLLPNWVEKLENPMIDWVKIYPGEVDESEPRIESAKITINPYYKKMPLPCLLIPALYSVPDIMQLPQR